MGEENEFSRYRLLYDELRERVERLGRRHRRVTALEAQLNALASELEELPEWPGEAESEIGWLRRECEGCGRSFITHTDAARCPECEG